jgi:hypothetical protein
MILYVVKEESPMAAVVTHLRHAICAVQHQRRQEVPFWGRTPLSTGSDTRILGICRPSSHLSGYLPVQCERWMATPPFRGPVTAAGRVVSSTIRRRGLPYWAAGLHVE